MKTFHISDLLSVTTGRLVSSRHMTGVYEILNFLTGDNLFTHQLPRANRGCEPWLQAQFPQLMASSPSMVEMLAAMDSDLEKVKGDRGPVIAKWVEAVRVANGLPEMVPVYEMGSDMHAHIDPLEEARAMMGDSRVIAVTGGQS